MERECTVYRFYGVYLVLVCKFFGYCYYFNIVNQCSLCCILFRMQMFIWNNIFFSLGFDVRDHYKDFGGDAAAYAAPVSANLHIII